MAIGLFFAFWSGRLETTAVYARSRATRKDHPEGDADRGHRLRLFYTFIFDGAGGQWGQDIGGDVDQRITIDLYFGLVQANLGGAFLDIYKMLLETGSFACALAFHNAASRYLFALGREIPCAAIHKTQVTPLTDAQLSLHRISASKRHHAGAGPAIRDFTAVQVPDADGNAVDTPALVPYTNVYGPLALIGTAAILLVRRSARPPSSGTSGCERPTAAT